MWHGVDGISLSAGSRETESYSYPSLLETEVAWTKTAREQPVPDMDESFGREGFIIGLQFKRYSESW